MNLWQEYWTPVRVLLGLGAEPQTLTFVQISLRGIIVFMFTLLMVRISARRSLARRTVFDSVFLVIPRLCTRARYLWISGFAPNRRRRVCDGCVSSIAGLDCVLFPWLRQSHQRHGGSPHP